VYACAGSSPAFGIPEQERVSGFSVNPLFFTRLRQDAPCGSMGRSEYSVKILLIKPRFASPCGLPPGKGQGVPSFDDIFYPRAFSHI
jgi:hypothetical protein